MSHSTPGAESSHSEDEHPSAESDLSDVLEVAFLLWVLLSSVKFKMSHFTLGSLESGLRNPSASDVMACTHTILLLDEGELESQRKKGSSFRQDFHSWSERLAETVRTWVENRRTLAMDLDIMENSEEDVYDEETVQWYKNNIEELDDLLLPLLRDTTNRERMEHLRKPTPSMQDVKRLLEQEQPQEMQDMKDMEDVKEEDVEKKNKDEGFEKKQPSAKILDALKDWEELDKNGRRERKKELLQILLDEHQAEESAIIDSVVPFRTSEEYLFLTPEQRLALLRALCLWRANGHPEPSVWDTIRLFDPDSLRQRPLGEDHLGRRYWYFPQFFRDCRVYRETPQDIHELVTEKKRQLEKERKVKEEDERVREEQKEQKEQEDNKQQKKEEEELKKLLQLESGRRTSSRRRTQVQRFEQEQAQELMRAAKKQKTQVEDEREKEETRKRSRSRGANKGKKKRRQDDSDSEDEFIKAFRDGPEPRPKEWKLVVHDIDSLRALVEEIASYKKRRNEDLLLELRDTLEHMEQEAENIRKAKLRQEKLDRMQAMPRKRSSRVQKVEEKRKQKEEEEREKEELLAAQKAERREKRKKMEEERKAKEREMRILEREQQKQLEEQRRLERLAARETVRQEEGNTTVQQQQQQQEVFHPPGEPQTIPDIAHHVAKPSESVHGVVGSSHGRSVIPQQAKVVSAWNPDPATVSTHLVPKQAATVHGVIGSYRADSSTGERGVGKHTQILGNQVSPPGHHPGNGVSSQGQVLLQASVQSPTPAAFAAAPAQPATSTSQVTTQPATSTSQVTTQPATSTSQVTTRPATSTSQVTTQQETTSQDTTRPEITSEDTSQVMAQPAVASTSNQPAEQVNSPTQQEVKTTQADDTVAKPEAVQSLEIKANHNLESEPSQADATASHPITAPSVSATVQQPANTTTTTQ